MGLSKLVDRVKNHSILGLPSADPAISGKPTKRQIYQSRYNFGVNFGGCFVAEKWIFHSIFPEGANCELEAVTKLEKDGKDAAKKKLEDHWMSYATDEDWKWLQDHGVTGIRVPLGYWNIDGGKYTKGTKFEKYADIYGRSWLVFKKHFVEPALSRNIGVLVDIHGLPGGANGNDHSGEKTGGSADFWGNSQGQKLMEDALAFVARDLSSYDNILGIQIVNESEFSDNPLKQRSYYSAAIKLIRHHDKTVPIIISDGWWPDQWAKWAQEHQDKGQSLGVVIDHHCYRCFDDKDKNKPADKVIKDLEGDLLTNINDNGNGVDFMVGEWSCVLDGKTWANTGLDPNDYGNGKRAEIVAQYGQQQLDLMKQRAGFGSFFWTYKFESGNGGEWDFRQMLGKLFNAPQVRVPDENKLNESLDGNFSAHKDYWNGQNPKEKYEHDRYKEGYTTAWNDGVAFAQMGSLIGRRQAVKAARLHEHIKNRGNSGFVWEWEQGYDKGTEEFVRASL